ncbi:triphosphoribosyl-dephospho-CoA synthase [Allomesorhizobium camelthorni]|uniref:Triphosphoribosyl-dephospho-CoA synthase n=1 Tax=Allomesorhizobium camelthorni TaxID=475069 RepID=A0A6G4WKC9_9HYPH|nr:triphosphoribosyl-dephospho-CoA synthase [Mesorhizobium camelthorni]NGO54808.1 triphosphoribosyl-dephospho-CoA synthase [Mesorhizobium camelthorni]
MGLSRERISTAYEEACRLEIEALKPGNVHLFAHGHGMTAGQFLLSASVSAGPLADPDLRVGRRILEAIRATRQAVGINTNLGIVLLTAPLARAAELAGGDLRENLSAVLDGLDMDDAGAVFEAIVVASPGGLGSAEEHDVREPPKVGVLEAMRAAAGRDRIARQYVTCFDDVFGTGLTALDDSFARGENGIWPTVFTYMAFLAGFPDSHVARKHGDETAHRIREEAATVKVTLDAADDDQARLRLLLDFDSRLKARSVNPGTSADLTVASLFVHILRQRLA